MRTAKHGEIFTPEISAYFKRLLRPEVKDPGTKESIKDDNPDSIPYLKVNAVYPDKEPLSTVPPNVLAALPPLPDDIEYRFVGKHVILRDVAREPDHRLHPERRSMTREVSPCIAVSPFRAIVSAVPGRRQPGRARRAGHHAAQPPDTLKFAIIGDSGTGSSSQYRVAKQLSASHAKYPVRVRRS